jgi:hypothetical protein
MWNGVQAEVDVFVRTFERRLEKCDTTFPLDHSRPGHEAMLLGPNST